MQLIPSIDLRGGLCVRLYQGDFAAETRYESAPRTVFQRYAALGAAWVHLVDLDGARDGEATNHAIIAELAALESSAIQAGGGVRSAHDVARLLDAGVGRVVVGSTAVGDSIGVREWIKTFGAERIVLAFDIRLDEKHVPFVTTHGWRQASTVTLWDAVARFGDLARHVLCTDVGRDGTLLGPNLELYSQAQTRFPDLAWQASGGVRDIADLEALAALGLAAAVSGRALLEHTLDGKEAALFLPNA